MLVSALGMTHTLHVPRKPAPVLRFRSAPQSEGDRYMAQIAQQHPVVKKMFDLIDIPSSTIQADARHNAAIEANLNRVRDYVVAHFNALGYTNIEHNEHGSLIVRIPGTPGLENAQPLMMTAHMDIVPGDPKDPTKAIKRQFKRENGREYITSDGTTTLGADDKGGLAMILENVAALKNKAHVPIEIIFSPDEESSCDSLRKLDTSKFKARHVLVVDEFYAFQATNGLASSVKIDIAVNGTNGGHSGENIADANRLNAIDLLTRINKKVGTGPIKMHPHYPNLPFISKNLGIIEGGSAINAIPESAVSHYMMRSFGKAEQEAELARIKKILQNFERRHKATQPNLKITMAHEEDYPAWQADPNSILPKICQMASKLMGGPKVKVEPTHAAAQASILATKKNAYGEQFDAVLIGPHIEEAHTPRERIDWKTLVSGNQWLSKIIDVYTEQAKKSLVPQSNPFAQPAV